MQLIKQHHKHIAGPEESQHLPPRQKWNWQDVLYLLILAGLVVAMAIRYTPDLTGEVAGEWWDPLLTMWTRSWDTAPCTVTFMAGAIALSQQPLVIFFRKHAR